MAEFERDFIMRQIKGIGAAIMRLFFHKDTTIYEVPPTAIEFTEADDLFKRLAIRIESGDINGAENMLFEELDVKNPRMLEVGIDFYMRLNDKSDATLEACNFSREEVSQGLQDLIAEFGIHLQAAE